jgi:hypothetical protein
MVDAYDIVQTEQICKEIIVAHQGYQIVCNITGGTKPMSLGVYRAAVRFRLPLYYVITEQGMVQCMESYVIREKPINVRMNCESFLIASGLERIPQKPFQESKQAANALASQWQSSYRLMGWISDQLKRIPLGDMSQKCLRRDAVTPQENSILMTLERNSLIRLVASDKVSATFTVEPAYRMFLEGVWLEVFVFHQLVRSKCFDDILHHVKIRRKNGVENEIDVLVTLNGKVACISCKTGKPEGRHLDELLVRADMLGRYTRRIFVSSQDYNEHLVRRAEEFNIRYIAGPDLMRITEIVQEELQRSLAATGRL